MQKLFNLFKQVWLVDFEFKPVKGGLPIVICMVARELRTGRTIRFWRDDLLKMKSAPFSVGPDSLFIAYFAPAEYSCFHSLGWELPRYCLDLFVEFKNHVNGKFVPNGYGLLSALVHHGLDALGTEEKDSMRNLALRGEPFTAQEKVALLDYCESDVVALERLLNAMISKIPITHALNRGRYIKAVSVIERVGVPIDMEMLTLLLSHWDLIKDNLVKRIDKGFGVFDGQTFKRDRFEKYLGDNHIPWPRHPSGTLMLDDDTFREMCRVYPQLNPIKELRHTLSQMRLSGLCVGADGRNRTMLSPFRAKTGRNQPSNTEFIFGPACWLRGLIRPPLGYSLAYIDWCQQEFGIAAALSGDPKMIAAYLSGDPYLTFAQQAGAIPPEGTKKTHGPIRDQFKACALAIQFGMGPDSLALRINQPKVQARNLLQLHRDTYPVFWNWSDAAVSYAMMFNEIQTVFGWTLHLDSKPNERSLRNFPMQGNGSELLRLACSLITEAGIDICAPVHDAILIMAPSETIDATVAKAKQLMEEASTLILNGFKLRADEKIIHHPDRYMDERGEKMWTAVQELISEIGKGDDVS